MSDIRMRKNRKRNVSEASYQNEKDVEMKPESTP